MNIHDIARIANVSISTVSKVMNGKDSDISAETRKKVLKVIEEQHYIPYLKFREKEGLKQHLIGLIVKRDNRERDQIVMAAEKSASRRGYHVIVCYVMNSEEVEQRIEELLQKNIDGILLDSDSHELTERSGCKILSFCQTEARERQEAIFYYRISDAGQMAAERLIAQGHQKIACIVERKDQPVLDGYRTALRQHNLPIRSLWTYEGESLEDIETYGIGQCFGQNITAVICGTTEIACCVYKFLERTGTPVPEEISLLVIGDGQILKILGNGLSAVSLPVETMCADAVEYLVTSIEEGKKVEAVRKFLPSLSERNSIMSPARAKQGEKIIVVGSMNLDVTVEVTTIPVKGETQLSHKVLMLPGGKGANQAVGCGKLGGLVYAVGRLGNDIDGKNLYSSLIEHHVHTDGVVFDMELPSGKAYINVDGMGESTIVVYRGANQNLDVEQVRHYKQLFKGAGYCLLSMEIPAETAAYTIGLCQRNQVKVILKPSAVDGIREELLSGVDIFVPNENELHRIVTGNGTLEEKTDFLIKKGVRTIIVTLGKRGCYVKNHEISLYVPGTSFEAVDTTGGADSFISALAVYLSEEKSLIHSVNFAMYAAGITVTRYGVQPALPDRSAVDIYEDEIRLDAEAIMKRGE